MTFCSQWCFLSTQTKVQQQVSVLSTLLYGRQPRLPFEVETLDKDITPTSEQIEDFKEKCKPYEETVGDHSTEMIKMQQEIFPQVMTNIEKAQEKQKKAVFKTQRNTRCQNN
jgi:hypothetical protein